MAVSELFVNSPHPSSGQGVGLTSSLTFYPIPDTYVRHINTLHSRTMSSCVAAVGDAGVGATAGGGKTAPRSAPQERQFIGGRAGSQIREGEGGGTSAHGDTGGDS